MIVPATVAASNRDGLVRALRTSTATERVLLFEPTGSPPTFHTSAAAGAVADASGFTAGGDVVRWLRVNRVPLVVAHRPDLIASFDDDERATLLGFEAVACIPLLDGADLRAWLLFGGADQSRARAPVWSDVQEAASRAFHQLRDEEDAQAAASKLEAVRHSQRLRLAGQLAATVAHEVKNPLAAIRSLIQFARDASLPEAQLKSVLTDVLEEVDRIDSGVRDMLRFSQRGPEELQEVNLSQIVIDSCRFIAAYATKREVALTVPSAQEAWVIRGDAREIRQVFVNVLINACQACERGGRVHVGLESPGSRGEDLLMVTVTDNGEGVDSADMAHVFGPFFTTKPDGTGLGLALSRDIVARHGGTIELESVRGSGTTVYIRLPRQH